MKKNVKMFLVVVLGLFFLIGDPGTIFAQDTEDAESNEFTLEEVTVTAQKREQDSQKVSIQMDVITGEELNERGVVDLRDALRNVSAAFVQDAAKDMQIVIRGMTNNDMPGDSVNQVAVSVDGAYSRNFLTGQSGFYDMQRVEVLAGPQGTLQGQNTSGGIVNLVSNDPNPDAVTGSASLGLGNYNYLTAQGVLNVPLSDILAFRAAFNSSSHDGYLSNGTMDDDTKSARFKLGYTPSEALSAVLTYEYTKVGGLSKSGFVVAFEDEDDVDDPWTSTIPGWTYRQDRVSDRFSLNLNWATPIGTVTILPAYAEYEESNAQQDPLKIDENGDPITGGGPPAATATTVGWRQQIRGHEQEEKSIEVRMASNEDAFLQWVLGYYYYDMEWTNPWTKARSELIDYGVWPDVISQSVQENDSNSVFGNVTIPVMDTLRLIAGARYTSDEEYRIETDFSEGTETISGPYENENTDIKIGTEYDLSDNVMLWADYSTGYKMGFRGNPSQELDSYQVGEKARFFDNRLQVNATAFYYDYDNFQISAGDMDYNGEQLTGNGYGAAEMYGLDFSTEYIITPRDRLNVSMAYLNADIKDATVTYSNFDGTVEYGPVVMTENLPELNGSPKLTLSASYAHIFEFPDGGSLTARIDPRYVSEKILQFQATDPDTDDDLSAEELNTEPAHTMLDASLTYYSPDDSWNINVWGKNLTNHAEKTGFYMNLEFMQIGAPRTFGATVSVKF